MRPQSEPLPETNEFCYLLQSEVSLIHFPTPGPGQVFVFCFLVTLCPLAQHLTDLNYFKDQCNCHLKSALSYRMHHLTVSINPLWLMHNNNSNSSILVERLRNTLCCQILKLLLRNFYCRTP